jgi:hypothetical protein
MRRWLAIAVLLIVPAVAAAQAKISRAHMEACVSWALVDWQYLTVNKCDTAIAIQFMTLYDSNIIQKNVLPGDTFESGAIDRSKATEMMFTVCPAGFRPNVAFKPENIEPISVSLYNCLPLEKPGA